MQGHRHLLKIFNKAFSKNTNNEIRHIYHKMQYGQAAPKPDELIWIDPNDIKYKFAPRLSKDVCFTRYGTHIIGGNWDQCPTYQGNWYSQGTVEIDSRHKVKLDNYLLYTSMKERFIQNKEWEDTQIFRYMGSNYEKVEEKATDYEQPDRMKKRLVELDTLFKEIHDDGYKTQRELNNSWSYPEENEVLVYMGRNGELILGQGGRHRLLIAKILELDSIPVRVNIQHKKYL